MDPDPFTFRSRAGAEKNSFCRQSTLSCLSASVISLYRFAGTAQELPRFFRLAKSLWVGQRASFTPRGDEIGSDYSSVWGAGDPTGCRIVMAGVVVDARKKHPIHVCLRDSSILK